MECSFASVAVILRLLSVLYHPCADTLSLGTNPSVECFALISWFSVPCIVHMLIHSMLTSKFSVARVAFEFIIHAELLCTD